MPELPDRCLQPTGRPAFGAGSGRPCSGGTERVREQVYADCMTQSEPRGMSPREEQDWVWLSSCSE